MYSFQFEFPSISNILQNYRTMPVYLNCFLISAPNFVYSNKEFIFTLSFVILISILLFTVYTSHVHVFYPALTE